MLKNNIYISSIIKLNKAINRKQKMRCVLLLALTIFNGILDLLGLALILPLIACFDTSIIHSNKYFNYIFNYFEFTEDKYFLTFLVSMMVFTFFIKNIFSIFVIKITAKTSYNISSELSEMQFLKEIDKGFLYFKNVNSNEISRAVMSIPQEFSTNIFLPLILMTNEILILIWVLTGLIIYDYQIFLLVLAIVSPGFILFYSLSKKKIQKLGEARNTLVHKPYVHLFTSIFGIADLIMSNSVNFFKNKIRNSVGDLNKVLVKLNVYESIPIKLIELSAISGMGVIFLYFILYSNNLSSLLGFLIVFITAAYRIMPSLNRILNSLVKLKSGTYIFDYIGSSKDQNEIIKKHQKTNISKIKFEKEISLSNMNFKYENDQKIILKDINLSIEKGDYVGIIGESGSGKTTLMNILLGLIPIESGEFKIDDDQINENNIVSFQNNIGYVQQTLYLKDGDIIENIAYGKLKDEVDFDLLNRCVENAMLADFVSQLPDGLNTNVGEFGAKISGGQKQRIAIARALYKEPQLIILDEATSALDNISENEVLKTISRLSSRNITIISIAHRLSSLVNCNKIYEIKNGIISEFSGENLKEFKLNNKI